MDSLSHSENNWQSVGCSHSFPAGEFFTQIGQVTIVDGFELLPLI
jgi:hypothetical protein